RGFFRRHGIGRIAGLVEDEKRDRSVQRARVEMREPEAVGEAARQRALSRSRRAVDRDNKGVNRHYSPRMTAPSPLISATKPGKLVAIGAASSLRTGRRGRGARTRNAIASRSSSCVSITAPPPGGPPL